VIVGHGLIVVSGDADYVALWGRLHNSGTSPTDVSVFGFSPQEVVAPGRVKVQSQVVSAGAQLSVQASPSGEGARFTLGLARPGKVRIDILTLDGREVVTAFEGAVGEGVRTVSWDGTAAKGARLSPGYYFARLSTPDGAEVSRLMVSR
jgi:hypothetical protein